MCPVGASLEDSFWALVMSSRPAGGLPLRGSPMSPVSRAPGHLWVLAAAMVSNRWALGLARPCVGGDPVSWSSGPPAGSIRDSGALTPEPREGCPAGCDQLLTGSVSAHLVPEWQTPSSRWQPQLGAGAEELTSFLSPILIPSDTCRCVCAHTPRPCCQSLSEAQSWGGGIRCP